MLVVERLRRCLETANWGALADVYAPDALLDANVPEWRFQRKGLDDIVAQYRDWYPQPVRITEWSETATDFGAVLEQAEQAADADTGDEAYSRSVHLFHVAGDRITRHVLYCTGTWDRATVERHALEAPVYEP